MAASLDTHHALIRFGLGPRPGEAKAIGDPRGWLLAQIQQKPREPAAGFAALPSSLDYFGREIDYIKEAAADKKQRGDQPTPQASPTQATAAVLGSADDPSPAGRKRKQPGQVQGFRKVFGADLLAEVRARYHWAISTEDGFHERLTHFWSNHFAVSLDKRAASLYVMPMEREAIRPNVGGRFEDMLLAVARHPAMLRYLDNVASVGDDSQAAQRLQQRAQQKGRKLGLNENLAREILELHTLGVDGGYSQSDVTEFARALTGWSMPRPRQLQGRAPSAAFEFYDITHEPGARTVLGKRYAEGGEEQAQAILHDLARHPATAKHLATKLTRHFVADHRRWRLVGDDGRAHRENLSRPRRRSRRGLQSRDRQPGSLGSGQSQAAHTGRLAGRGDARRRDRHRPETAALDGSAREDGPANADTALASRLRRYRRRLERLRCAVQTCAGGAVAVRLDRA